MENSHYYSLKPLQLSVAVNIQVRQVNFAPVFYSSHYFATIMEDLEVGDVVIADIEAIDFDLVIKFTSEAVPYEYTERAMNVVLCCYLQGTNGHIEYAFANPGLVSPPLAIDSETAIVTLTQNIDYDSGDTSFKFNVSTYHYKLHCNHSSPVQLTQLYELSLFLSGHST